MPKGGIGDYPYATFLSSNGKKGAQIKAEKGSLQSLLVQESLKARSKGLKKNKDLKEKRAATAIPGQPRRELSVYSYQSSLETQSILLRKGNGTAPAISHNSQWERWDNSALKNPKMTTESSAASISSSPFKYSDVYNTTSQGQRVHQPWGSISSVGSHHLVTPMYDVQESATEDLNQGRLSPGPQPYGNASTTLQPCKFDHKHIGPLLFGEDDDFGGLVVKPSHSAASVQSYSSDRSVNSLNSTSRRGRSPNASSPRLDSPPPSRIESIDLVIPTATIPSSTKLKLHSQQPQVDPSNSATLPILSPLAVRGGGVGRAATAPSSIRSELEEVRNGGRPGRKQPTERHTGDTLHQNRMNQSADSRSKTAGRDGLQSTASSRRNRFEGGVSRRGRRVMDSSLSPQKSALASLSSSRSVLGVLMSPPTYDGFAEGSFNFRSTSPTHATYIPGDELTGGSPMAQLERQARTPKKHYTTHLDPRPCLRSTLKPGTSTYLTLARK